MPASAGLVVSGRRSATQPVPRQGDAAGWRQVRPRHGAGDEPTAAMLERWNDDKMDALAAKPDGLDVRLARVEVRVDEGFKRTDSEQAYRPRTAVIARLVRSLAAIPA